VLKESKIRRKNVGLHQPARPSRIRRDPVTPIEQPRRGWLANIDFQSREWEIGMAIAGIIFFALAINAVIFDIGHFLGN
jgi:hypothetical protein